MSDSPTPDDKPPAHWPALLDLPFIQAEFGVSRAWVYLKMAEEPPGFPIAVKASNLTRWHAQEVWDWKRALPRITPRGKAA